MNVSSQNMGAIKRQGQQQFSMIRFYFPGLSQVFLAVPWGAGIDPCLSLLKPNIAGNQGLFGARMRQFNAEFSNESSYWPI
tara:strand:- start:101959 stop:102201 length:243 start_codon:yes stop_codon:yes gene_type:complete